MTIMYHIPDYLIEDEDNCCTKINPSHWDRKLFDFSNLNFVRIKSSLIFHVPYRLHKVIKEVKTIIKHQESKYLVLTQNASMFSSTHFMHVKSQNRMYKHHRIKGVFRAYVFEGEYKNIPKWKQSIKKEWAMKGLSIKEQFVYFTSCPNCAQKLGYNYVVIFTR